MTGKKVSEEILDEIKIEVDKTYTGQKSAAPSCGIGWCNNPASETYVGSKIKACERVGFKSTLVKLPDTIDEASLLNEIKKLNDDTTLDGL